MKQKLIIVILLFFTAAHANEDDAPKMPQTAYSFFVSVARFVTFPIRYFTAPYFRLNDIPTQDHLERFEQVKQLKKENKEVTLVITNSTEQIPWDQGRELLLQMAKKDKKQTKIVARINVANVFLAQQHDDLTLLEQIFTDRKKELHEHLWVTTKKLWEVSHK